MSRFVDSQSARMNGQTSRNRDLRDRVGSAQALLCRVPYRRPSFFSSISHALSLLQPSKYILTTNIDISSRQWVNGLSTRSMNRYINTYSDFPRTTTMFTPLPRNCLTPPSFPESPSVTHRQSPTDLFPVNPILPLIWPPRPPPPPAHRPRASTQLSDSLSYDLNMNGPDSQMDRHRYKHSANICLYVTRYVLPSMAMEGALTLCKYMARTRVHTWMDKLLLSAPKALKPCEALCSRGEQLPFNALHEICYARRRGRSTAEEKDRATSLHSVTCSSALAAAGVAAHHSPDPTSYYQPAPSYPGLSPDGRAAEDCPISICNAMWRCHQRLYCPGKEPRTPAYDDPYLDRRQCHWVSPWLPRGLADVVWLCLDLPRAICSSRAAAVASSGYAHKGIISSSISSSVRC
jgi:hypothetical protein